MTSDSAPTLCFISSIPFIAAFAAFMPFSDASTVTFSARATEKAKVFNNKKQLHYENNKYKIINLNKNKEKELIKIQGKIKEIMWEKAGIIRTKKRLKEALTEIKKLEQELKNDYLSHNLTNTAIIETESIITVAKLIIEASLKRNRSVGCFYLSQ